MHVKIRGLVVIAAVLALALSGCASASDTKDAGGPQPTKKTSTATPSPTKPTATRPAVAPPPKNGACRVLRVADISPASNATPPVACSARHTAFTFTVGTWPSSLTGTVKSVGDPRLGAYVGKACGPRFRKVLGANAKRLALSQFSYAWFKPSQADFTNGAHWFRCDVVAGTGLKKLIPLPAKLGTVLGSKVPARFAQCWTTRYGSGNRPGRAVTCDKKHAQRAVDYITPWKAKDSFPGKKKVQSRAASACRSAVDSYLSASNTYVGYNFPTKKTWKSGRRWVTCWVAD